MKKRILFLCRRIPWPLAGGPTLRNYWFLKSLSREYVVDLVAARGHGVPPEIGQLCSNVIAFSGEEDSWRIKLLRLAETGRTGSYFIAGALASSALRRSVASSLNAYDYH